MYIYINVTSQSIIYQNMQARLLHILHNIRHVEITFLIGLVSAFKFVNVTAAAQIHNVPRACFVSEFRSDVIFPASLCPDSCLWRFFQLLFWDPLPDRVVHAEVNVISALDVPIDLPLISPRMGRKGT